MPSRHFSFGKEGSQNRTDQSLAESLSSFQITSFQYLCCCLRWHADWLSAGASREKSPYRRSGRRHMSNGQSTDINREWRRPMSTLWQDLRYGVRILAKQPGFTLIAIITL